MSANIAWEKQAYGSTQASIIESVEKSLTFKLSGPGMIIASYLSDAQELMSCNTAQTQNEARQYINIAKMLMMHYNLGFKGE